jgi:hypothetical protein
MKKLMISATLVANAAVANAQTRNDARKYESNDYAYKKTW